MNVFTKRLHCVQDKRNIGSAFDHLFGRLLSLLLVGSASLSDGYSMQSSISVQFLTAAVDALYYLLVLSEAQVMDGKSTSFDNKNVFNILYPVPSHRAHAQVCLTEKANDSYLYPVSPNFRS